MGIRDEVDQVLPALRVAFDVIDESQPYPCRPPSRLVRVYLEVRLPASGGGSR